MQSPSASLERLDLWARVDRDGLPAPLRLAVERKDWLQAKTELSRVMDGQTTDGVYVAHPHSVTAYDSHQGFVQTFGEGHLVRTGGIGVDGSSQDVFVTDAAKDEGCCASVTGVQNPAQLLLVT